MPTIMSNLYYWSSEINASDIKLWKNIIDTKALENIDPYNIQMDITIQDVPEFPDFWFQRLIMNSKDQQFW